MKHSLYIYLIIIIAFTIFAQCAITGTHNSLLGLNPTHVYSHTYTFNGGGGNTFCQFVLTFPTNTYQAYPAIMHVDKTNTGTYSTNINDYNHYDPRSFTRIDLLSAIKGQPQTVQISGLTATTTLYINIAVNTGANFGYNIAITQGSTSLSKCLPPGISSPSPSLFCSSCSTSFMVGPYCDILDRSLSNNSQLTQLINPGKYSAFTISGASSQITLNFGSDNNFAHIFIQFRTFSQQAAGMFNVVPSGGGYASYLITNPAQTYQITINSGGSDVMVGVINQNSAAINFTVWYTVQSSLNILVIVLGVLGGLLLIALIVVACFVIRRMRNPTQIIHPQASANLLRQAQIQQNMLSKQEIQTYFPSITSQAAFTDLQSSSLDLNTQKQLSNIDKDCVICLCPVEGTDLMKVTYCKHIFHAHCLVEWFKKQRNCPYCRQEYSKSSTIQHYQHLLKQTKKNMLAGNQLVLEIIKLKQMKSTIVIEDVKQ